MNYLEKKSDRNKNDNESNEMKNKVIKNRKQKTPNHTFFAYGCVYQRSFLFFSCRVFRIYSA